MLDPGKLRGCINNGGGLDDRSHSFSCCPSLHTVTATKGFPNFTSATARRHELHMDASKYFAI
jgi:hypothetical protein